MESTTNELIRSLIVLLFFIALFAGTIVLQVYLSRRESRWPGLVLPILSFVLALTAALAVTLSTAGPGTLTVEEYGSDGTVINTQTTEVDPWLEPEPGPRRSVGETLIGGGIVFLVANIPTLIYTAIYFGEREKFRRRQQMKKMNIQDLE